MARLVRCLTLLAEAHLLMLLATLASSSDLLLVPEVVGGLGRSEGLLLGHGGWLLACLALGLSLLTSSSTRASLRFLPRPTLLSHRVWIRRFFLVHVTLAAACVLLGLALLLSALSVSRFVPTPGPAFVLLGAWTSFVLAISFWVRLVELESAGIPLS